jgi:hypothetical protein
MTGTARCPVPLDVRYRSSVPWEPNEKGGFIVLPRSDIHGALVRLHDLFDDVQPETQALAAARFALPGPEWIEQMRQHFRRNGAAVLDGQRNTVARVPSSRTATGTPGLPCLSALPIKLDATWAMRAGSQTPVQLPSQADSMTRSGTAA